MATAVNRPIDACVFALEREAAAFLRHYPDLQAIANAPCRAALCGNPPLLVLQTGVGPRRMEKALDWLFQQPQPPARVISAGYSGALAEDLHVGDVIMADEVVDEAGGRWVADSVPASLRRGRVLCVPRLIGAPAEKRRLGLLHDAVAVDMESATVARRCAERQVQFICLRVISDDVATALDPRLASLLGGSQVSIGKVLALLLRSPVLILELIRLARDTRRASSQLAIALHEVIAGSGR